MYSLGMLLYELLYNETPSMEFEPHQLEEIHASREQLLDLDIQYVAL